MAKKTKSEIKKRIADLRKLDISKMYMNDFYLTWDKTDDEIAAVFEVALILVLESPSSVTTPQEQDSPLHLLVTFLDLKFRILMRRRARLHMVRLLERQPT